LLIVDRTRGNAHCSTLMPALRWHCGAPLCAPCRQPPLNTCFDQTPVFRCRAVMTPQFDFDSTAAPAPHIRFCLPCGLAPPGAIPGVPRNPTCAAPPPQHPLAPPHWPLRMVLAAAPRERRLYSWGSRGPLARLARPPSPNTVFATSGAALRGQKTKEAPEHLQTAPSSPDGCGRAQTIGGALAKPSSLCRAALPPHQAHRAHCRRRATGRVAYEPLYSLHDSV
jgi:hypothetical protein